MNLSVIIPAYNEGKKINKTLDETLFFLTKKANLTYEIIVVNDGSTDDTLKILKDYSEKYDNIHIVSYVKNRGKGYAVKTGVENADGEQILFMDADHSVKIDNVDVFLSSQKTNDISIGSIYIKPTTLEDNNGILRKLLRKFSYKIPKLFLGIQAYDTQRGFKMFSRKAADIIFAKQTINGFGFDIEILYIAKKYKLSINEIPVIWKNPTGHHVKLLTYIHVAIDILNIIKNNLFKKYKK